MQDMLAGYPIVNYQRLGTHWLKVFPIGTTGIGPLSATLSKCPTFPFASECAVRYRLPSWLVGIAFRGQTSGLPFWAVNAH